jgi:hypothetical protein
MRGEKRILVKELYFTMGKLVQNQYLGLSWTAMYQVRNDKEDDLNMLDYGCIPINLT